MDVIPTLTCLICPNGCGLKISRENDTYQIRGNRCIKGVDFARNQLKKTGISGNIRSAKAFLHYDEEHISQILSLWDLPLNSLEENRFIQGSPERSLYRTSLLSGSQRLILEQIEPEQASKHEKTALRLDRLKKVGLPVTPFLRGKNGRVVQEAENRFWQLTPFSQGIALNRNNYWQDAWRGEGLGRFLCRLYEREQPDSREPSFNLIDFINSLVEKISLNHRDLLLPLNPILQRLEETVFPVYKDIPTVFGHGDPHPLNIIWGEGKIETIIDWEFCGTKPILYDASLVMGCVGSESPEAFDSPFNRAFYGEIKKAIPPLWLGLLPDFILAQRFAWLNEWLRHEDETMVLQEIRYMEMLL
ncbi:MAG: phosphotransferase [Spirochaetales bacterium]|nr:phosphotransferase [Spirochaetales bacterium]